MIATVFKTALAATALYMIVFGIVTVVTLTAIETVADGRDRSSDAIIQQTMTVK